MSGLLSCIRNDYSLHFPKELPMKAAQGFFATAAIALIAGSGAGAAIFRGAIAITATLIEAVTRPIIKSALPEHPYIAECIQVYGPRTIGLHCAGLIPSSPFNAADSGLSFVLSLIAWFCLNREFYEKGVAMVEVL